MGIIEINAFKFVINLFNFNSQSNSNDREASWNKKLNWLIVFVDNEYADKNISAVRKRIETFEDRLRIKLLKYDFAKINGEGLKSIESNENNKVEVLENLNEYLISPLTMLLRKKGPLRLLWF